MIRNILNKNKSKSYLPYEKKINNCLIKDKETIAHSFNKYFANIGSTLASGLKDVPDNSHMNYLNDPVLLFFSFQNVDEDTVSKLIDNINSKNSSGVDELSTILIKLVKSNLLKPLTTIINQSLHTDIFPDKLKIAKVIPLFKKGDPTLIENYRPISLLTAISKIFERVIFNQVNAYFTLKNLFYDKQYGFRKYHSTELAALNVVDTIVNHMDDENTPFAVYLDLSKAFDTLKHSILLDKLKFFRGTSINLIKHYLSNRKQCVEIDRLRSSYINISTGVPQGSILGPLLFIIYMNDLPNASRLFKCIIYADDTTFIANLNDFYAKHDSGLNNNILNDELEKNKLLVIS